MQHSSKWAKIKEITSLVATECKNNAKYPVCLFAYMVHAPIIPLFSMTGILWIASFIDEGKVENDLEAKKIYKHASIIAMVSALVLLPLISQLSDRVSPLVMLPASFLLRCLVGGSFQFVKDPKSLFTIFLFTALVVMSATQYLVVKAWYNRRMSKEIRGNMSNIMEIFSTAGLVIFVLLTGKAFDTYGPSSPFTILAGCDLVVVLLASSLACFGVLKA